MLTITDRNGNDWRVVKFTNDHEFWVVRMEDDAPWNGWVTSQGIKDFINGYRPMVHWQSKISKAAYQVIIDQKQLERGYSGKPLNAGGRVMDETVVMMEKQQIFSSAKSLIEKDLDVYKRGLEAALKTQDLCAIATVCEEMFAVSDVLASRVNAILEQKEEE